MKKISFCDKIYSKWFPLLLCLVGYSFASVYAQELALEKVVPLQTDSVNLSNQTIMKMDDRGNTYLAGRFKSTITFAGHTLSSGAIDNLFLIKFDPAGNVISSIHVKVYFDLSDEENKVTVRDMTVDKEENVFFIAGIEGNSGGNLSVEDGHPFFEPIFFESQEDFLIKYDSKAGTASYPKKIPELDNTATLTNKENKIYLAGNAAAGQEIFLEQYDNNLNLLTIRKTLIQTGLEGVLSLRKIALDNKDNILLAGSFRGTAIFGPTSLFSNGEEGRLDRNDDVYLARFDNAGNFEDVRHIASENIRINVKDMTIDEKDRVYLTGLFNGKASFPSTTGATVIESEDKDVDIYFASYEGKTLRYAYPLKGKDYDEPTAIAVDDQYLYLAGYIKNEINFNVAPKEPKYSLNGGGSFDVFIAKYERENARLIHATPLKSDNDDNRSGGLAIRQNAGGESEIYLSGYFGANTIFDPYTGGGKESGNKDIFWAKYIEKVSKADQATLEKLYNSTGGKGWDKQNNWLQNGKSVEDWYGISVSAEKNIDTINLSNNGLKGAIPEDLAKLGRGQPLAIDLSDNQLEGKIPKITATTINLSGNLYTFKDLVPFLEAGNTGIIYIPQAPIGKAETVLLKKDESRTFTSADTTSGNQYKWYKNDIPTESLNKTITLTVPQDTGTYVCKITNPGAPALTLESRPITVTLQGEGQLTITGFTPSNMEAGDTLTVNGTNFGSDRQQLMVAIGGQKADVVTVAESGTQLQAIVPDTLAPGKHGISVAFNGGDTVTIQEEVTIIPRLDSLSDSIGVAGSEVVAYGANFRSETGKISVHILDEVFIENTLVLNEEKTSITFKIPPLDSGLYEVQVIVNEVPSVVLLFRVVKEPVPKDTTLPKIVALDIPKQSEQKVIAATLQATDAESDISKVTLAYAGLTHTLGAAKDLTATPDSLYRLEIPQEAFDELGVQYQIIATNKAGLSDTLSGTIYRSYPAQPMKLYNLPKDKPQVQDYQIIAIPFARQTVASIWEQEKAYDIKQWRLFGYNTADKKYQEYKSEGFIDFEPGKGYMFIQRTGFKFDIAGQVVKPDHVISLKDGYNLIGNPYPFDLDWNAVKSTNPGLGDLNLVTYRNGSIGGATILRAYEGGFLYVEKDTTITIPAKTINARKAPHPTKEHKNALTESSWFVNLNVTSESLGYRLAGFGMHEEAQPGKDRLDTYPVPRFLSYLEGSFRQPVEGDKLLAKDIVPTAEEHIWQFEVASNLPTQQVTLSWDNRYFGDNDKQLMLLDMQNYQIIPMREQQEYRFVMQEGVHPFKVFFGTEETIARQMVPVRVVVRTPYPNPAAAEVFIPVSLPESLSAYAVSVTIFDQTGRTVALLNQASLPVGFHTLRWDRQDSNNITVAPGLYFYQVHIAGNTQVYRGKIWLQ